MSDYRNNIDRPLKTKYRFEIKYLVNAVDIEAILHFARPFLMADPYTTNRGGYIVNSLYFDSPGLKLYQSSDTGEKNRFKLRMRTYTDAANMPVFVEIKRRMDNVIHKQRSVVHRSATRDIVEGLIAVRGMLADADGDSWANLVDFDGLLRCLDAHPTIQVCYDRRAYFDGHDPSVRMTIDHNLRFRRVSMKDWSLLISGSGWIPYRGNVYIIEIKFNEHFPFWVNDLIRKFSLLRGSFSKYCKGIDTLETEGLCVADAGAWSVL
jgi:SPX domain protein involved in polyphosphate accumulation